MSSGKTTYDSSVVAVTGMSTSNTLFVARPPLPEVVPPAYCRARRPENPARGLDTWPPCGPLPTWVRIALGGLAPVLPSDSSHSASCSVEPAPTRVTLSR